MKIILTSLFFILVINHCLCQQIDLDGRVSIHNSHYRTGQIEYVQGAYVEAPFAGSTSSDIQGEFTLTFQGIAGGTAIQLSVEKEGLEVVNRYDLERVILGQKPVLPVYLAPKGYLAQAQTDLYNISKEALFAERDARIERLLENEQESNAAIAELEEYWGMDITDVSEAIELLNEKMDDLEKQLPAFTQALATKNLDFASDLYIRAYELYEAGKIEESIAALSDFQLEQSLQDAIVILNEGRQLEEIGREIQERGEAQINQIVDSYELKAHQLSQIFQFRTAAEYYERILQILRENQVKDEMYIADIYGELAIVYEELGEYSLALSFQQEDIKIKELSLPERDPGLVTSYSNLAQILRDLGQYEDAIEAQQQAIAIGQSVPGRVHPDLGDAYSNLALILRDLSRYDSALAIQRQALSIQESSPEADYRDLATSYNNLGLIYYDLGRYEEALEMQLQAHGIYLQHLRNDDPLLATSYNNLASINQMLGKYEMALELQEQALNIRREILHPYHPKLALSYGNLGQLYLAVGNYELAENAQEEALRIMEQIFNNDHPRIAINYNNLAGILMKQGRYQEAKEAWQTALSITKKSLGPDHHRVATYSNNLTWAYKMLGEPELAIEALRQALAIYKKRLDPNHHDIANCHNNFVGLFHSQGQLDSAIVYAEIAYSIWLKNQGPPSRLQSSKARLATLCEERGQERMNFDTFARAIADFEDAIVYGGDTASLLYNIGLCYYSLEDFYNAIEYFDKSFQSNGVDQYTYLNSVGMALAKVGDLAKAYRYFEQSQELLPDEGTTYRNWAFYYALGSEPDRAIEELERAISLGYDDWEWIRTEEGLDLLRDNPRFQSLLELAPLENK